MLTQLGIGVTCIAWAILGLRVGGAPWIIGLDLGVGIALLLLVPVRVKLIRNQPKG